MIYDYTFKNYQDDLITLATSIHTSQKKYDLIVGVERGGLILAVHLSHILGAPMSTLKWSTRDGAVQEVRNPDIMYANSLKQNILVVDDIVDNGITAKGITGTYPFVDYASLIYNNINQSNFTPTYYGWEINRNEIPQWINFWWERT